MGHRQALNIVEFLHDMAARGETLQLVDEQLQYRARQGAAQQQTIQTIQQHKPELIAWLRERSTNHGAYPLSKGQQGLWMAWQLDPHTPIYNLFTVARLQPDVDLASLQRAAQALLDRHPVLRTVYPIADRATAALPMQHVQSEQPVAFTLLDGANWTATQIDQWMEQEADRPFDLRQGPLMRMIVLRTLSAAGQPVDFLHWTIHHIASDFFTQEILLEELEACYQAIRQGRQPALPIADLTYQDFVRWEADQLLAQEEKLASFWRVQLGDEPPILNLPTTLAAAARPADISYLGKTLDFAFDPEQTEQLRAFARVQQTTLFTLLLAAYQIVLARYSGQERLFITSPTSVRTLPGWERTAGYLVNPLFLSADLAGNPSVAGFLKRVQQMIAAAFEHQIYPYGAVLRQLQAANPASQPSKVAAGFILDTARKPATAPTLFADVVAVGQRGAAEDFSLSIFDLANNLSGRVTYNAQLFSPATVAQMIGHFKTLLQRMMADPEQPIRQLPLLTEAERHEMVSVWNQTAVAYPKDKCIHQLFEEQAARTPDAVAVIFGGQRALTYGELNARANRLAHHLRAQGVGAETLVGICVERSPEMVVGLLGILKAGGAYVPLDPSYPRQRLAFMLQDAGVAALLTQSQLLDRLPPTTARVICLDRDWTEIGAQPSDNPDSPGSPVRADNLAYVIYTSGSTGQPKGVQAPHQAAVNRFAWMWRAMPFAAHEVCCQKTALSFVDSVWEIFGPLLQGVPSVIIPDAVVKDPSRFVTTLRDHKVTRLVLVPSLLRAMLESEAQLQARLPHLTHWVCSGEALSIELVQRFYAQLPNARLINLYGSSEVAADATWYDTRDLPHTTDPQVTSVPIGQPIANIQCYILDGAQQPAPPGVQGELYIGGDGLARGYHQRPDLTNERFIPNPFGPGRLFKTGDLARWLLGSTPQTCPNIEFLGRADHQVKLRGFRIELGEIEAALRQHTAVQEAIVVVLDGADEEKRLVAYLVGEKVNAQDPSALSELRDHLTRKLPDYMIPAAFVLLDALPLTPNGKVDRKALPAPDGSAIVKNAEFAPPQTPIEEALADIWARNLGVTPVGRHDHFFVMGGHSLLATQVMTSIQQRLQTTLPIRAIFDHPTLAGLAEQIAESQLAAKLQDCSTVPVEDEMEFVL